MSLSQHLLAAVILVPLALLGCKPSAGSSSSAKDAVWARAEALLDLLRAEQYGEAAAFVDVSTDDPAEETRRRLGIPTEADPMTIRAKVATWFEDNYSYNQHRRRPGTVHAVEISERNQDIAMVSYRHGDIDGFTMRRIGDTWYYTLASEWQ